MRKLLLNIAGAAALSWGALVMSASAQAAPVTSLDKIDAPVATQGIDTVQYRERHRPSRPNYRPTRPDYRPGHRPGYRPGYRPAVRCWVENRRVWNGYRWTRRPVRFCR